MRDYALWILRGVFAAIVVGAVLLGGCAPSLRPPLERRALFATPASAPAKNPVCDALDAKHRVAVTVSAFAGFLATGSGLSVVLEGDPQAQQIAGLVAVGAGALAAGATQYAADAAARYNEICAVQRPPEVAR